MLDWDDYRLLLAIARSRGLAGAAERECVTFSTVFRRLDRIEKTLGESVFYRIRGGYEPTDLGRIYVEAAESMAEEVLRAGRICEGVGAVLSGRLRITATEVLATFFLAPQIPAFKEKYPNLAIELLPGNKRMLLADGEADIALRPSMPEEPYLFGRKIADLHWGMFAAKGTGISWPLVPDQGLITWSGAPISDTFKKRIGARFPQLSEKSSSTSLITNAATVRAGLDISYLPLILGQMWPGLTCIHSPLEDLRGEAWDVCHEDMKRSPRIRAFFDFLIEAAKDAFPEGGQDCSSINGVSAGTRVA